MIVKKSNDLLYYFFRMSIFVLSGFSHSHSWHDRVKSLWVLFFKIHNITLLRRELSWIKWIRTVNGSRPCDAGVMSWVLLSIQASSSSCCSWINETNSKTNSQRGSFLFLRRLHSHKAFYPRPTKQTFWGSSFPVLERANLLERYLFNDRSAVRAK